MIVYIGTQFRPSILTKVGQNLNAIHRQVEGTPVVLLLHCGALRGQAIRHEVLPRKSQPTSVSSRVPNLCGRIFSKIHPSFQGKVALVGHSLGSIILWDLLVNQVRTPENEDLFEPGLKVPKVRIGARGRGT